MSGAALGRIAALAAGFVLVSAAATPAYGIRHVDYRLAFGRDGAPQPGTVRLDFVSAGTEGAVTVDVADDDAVPVRARIDRSGGISTVLDQTLSDADLNLLGAVALEAENLNGATQGDEWSHTTAVPGGRTTVHYKVMRNDDRGHVSLSVARTVQREDGEASTWRGTIEYDANAFVPVAVTATGRVHAFDDPESRAHNVSVSLKMLNDSFSHKDDRD